jgi:hypothetical protein
LLAGSSQSDLITIYRTSGEEATMPSRLTHVVEQRYRSHDHRRHCHIYTQFMGVAPVPEAGLAPAEAPVTLCWILMVIGIAAVTAGFALERRKSPN